MITNPQARTEDVAGHYDELDRFYRELWGEHLHHGLWDGGADNVDAATDRLLQWVAARLPLEPGMRVADVGCGYGATAQWLAERHAVDVVGYTLSPRQFEVAEARRPAAGRLTFRLQDWLANDLATASLDGLVSIECIGHVADKAGFFAEIARTLKPGARAVFTAWLSAPAPSPAARRHLLQPICREGRLPSMGTANEYVELAERAGLRTREVRDLTRQVRRTWLVCAQRMLGALIRQADARRYVLSAASRHRGFALSVLRLLYSQTTRSMRYGLFVLQAPGGSNGY